MRMWNVPPRKMCDKHLLGEHVEMHMFLGSVRRGRSLAGYIAGGLVETHRIVQRHDQLAAEMTQRGMNHRSPLQGRPMKPAGRVNVRANLRELARRCVTCRKRQRT
jgi:hypothetical protein